jgi:hypothetical protein
VVESSVGLVNFFESACSDWINFEEIILHAHRNFEQDDVFLQLIIIIYRVF